MEIWTILWFWVFLQVFQIMCDHIIRDSINFLTLLADFPYSGTLDWLSAAGWTSGNMPNMQHINYMNWKRPIFFSDQKYIQKEL